MLRRWGSCEVEGVGGAMQQGVWEDAAGWMKGCSRLDEGMQQGV